LFEDSGIGSEHLGNPLYYSFRGEPFVYPDLFQMIEEHPQVFFQVYTNGTLMTREKAKRLSELGNLMVVISIEGYEEEADRWQGKGIYKKIMNAFNDLREARVLIGTSATVTKENVEVAASIVSLDPAYKVGFAGHLAVNGTMEPEVQEMERRIVSQHLGGVQRDSRSAV
jgi:MoaA/NifB/PqqE/SkfB family radical SAM enzyme